MSTTTDRIIDFVEKPAGPAGHAGQARRRAGLAWASTCSTPTFLFDELRRDAADPDSSHDFGKDIIPYIVENGRPWRTASTASCVRSGAEAAPYWRDVGTVDAYWQANIDLTEIVPELDLYDRDWPIWTYAEIDAAGEVRA